MVAEMAKGGASWGYGGVITDRGLAQHHQNVLPSKLNWSGCGVSAIATLFLQPLSTVAGRGGQRGPRGSSWPTVHTQSAALLSQQLTCFQIVTDPYPRPSLLVCPPLPPAPRPPLSLGPSSMDIPFSREPAGPSSLPTVCVSILTSHTTPWDHQSPQPCYYGRLLNVLSFSWPPCLACVPRVRGWT